jgi:hypothetical protein
LSITTAAKKCVETPWIQSQFFHFNSLGLKCVEDHQSMSLFFDLSSQFWVVKVVIFSMQYRICQHEIEFALPVQEWTLAVEIACPSWGESD